MTNFINDSEGFTARSGLYCVWVPLRDDGKAPLVSIWIDSRMTSFETRSPQDSIGLCATNESVMAGQFEDPKQCDMSVQHFHEDEMSSSQM